MLGTLMTALYFFARAIWKFGTGLFQEEPLHYRVYQPLPWHIQNVSRNARSSWINEKNRSRENRINSLKGTTGIGVPEALAEENSLTESNAERAAVMIQTQYRRYQQRRNPERQ